MHFILLIEDEPGIADTIQYALSTEGFQAEWCTTGHEGLSRIESGNFSVIIIDIGLPDMNGFDLCRIIRQKSTVPIIFLTARDSEIDRVAGLEMGADDYVVKPFSPRELTARVRAILRRTAEKPTEIDHGPSQSPTKKFIIDEQKLTVHYYGTVLELSRYEFSILRILINNPGRVYSREELMHYVWEEPDSSLDRTVDTHIKTIRRKCREIKPEDNPIETRRGFGYALRVDN